MDTKLSYKRILDSVEYANDSTELCMELEDRYDQINGAKLYQTQKEINDMDITGYETRMKKLWKELSTSSFKYHCNCTCIYGVNDSMHEAEQDRYLFNFLLN